MWKWALLVSSVAAAEPLPIGITVGGGWRYPSGEANLRAVSGGYSRLEPVQDMGTLDASALVQLPKHFGVGLHVTTASTLRVLGQYDTATEMISSALLLRPVTLAIAARYVWRPFWVTPWIGREFLHARYSIKTSGSQSSTTVRHNGWDDNGPVIGVAAGVDLLSHACFAMSMYAEIETVFDGGRDDLAYTPYIDSAFTFGFGVRYQ